MDDFRIVSSEELKKEEIFEKSVRALEKELKVGRIEYALFITTKPPLIITNGDKFDMHVTKKGFEIFHKIFNIAE
ncbi:MAG: hypothetical protein NVSMB24_39650 [Mucilaginibacter sp.]